MNRALLVPSKPGYFLGTMSGVHVGAKLGRYELVSELGQGGMSVVYRGRDPKLQREVAVKVMHGFLAEQPESRERFRREAVAVAHLKHPHIIEIYDYSEEHEDVSYIVAELVDGMSLADFLDGQPARPPEAALLLARPLADALQHAHEAGVIHRDLKPENVLVDRRGTVKLTDFGIARMIDSQTLTITGTLLGSPAYMSPEYIDGQEPDARSDIFSFGAMLYQMTVGALPFHGPSPHALLKRIASGAFTPANQINPHIHARLAKVIHRCLEREPSARYPSAAELVRDLDEILSRLDIELDDTRKRYLHDPKCVGRELEASLRPTYLALGKNELASERVGAATDDFDRVLSLDPNNQEVRKILDRLARRAFLGRAGKLISLGAAGAALLSALGVWWLGRPGPAPVESPTPTAILASVSLPPADAVAPPRIPVNIRLRGTGDLLMDGLIFEDDHQSFEMVSHPNGTRILVPVGEHRFTFRNQNKLDEQVVTIREGVLPPDIDLDISESPAPTAARPTPRPAATPTSPPAVAEVPRPKKTKEIAFNAKRWVNVFVNDSPEPVQRYAQGRFELELPYGLHRLRFENDFGKPMFHSLLVDDNPVGLIVVDLEPKDAQLRLNGIDVHDHLTVEVAGRKHLVTKANANDPILVPMTEGRAEHPVRIQKEGFAPFEEKVTFVSGKLKELEVKLTAL